MRSASAVMTNRRYQRPPRRPVAAAAPELGSKAAAPTGSPPLHIERSGPVWALQEALDRLEPTASTQRSKVRARPLHPEDGLGEASTPKAASNSGPGSTARGNRAAYSVKGRVIAACNDMLASLNAIDRLVAPRSRARTQAEHQQIHGSPSQPRLEPLGSDRATTNAGVQGRRSADKKARRSAKSLIERLDECRLAEDNEVSQSAEERRATSRTATGNPEPSGAKIHKSEFAPSGFTWKLPQEPRPGDRQAAGRVAQRENLHEECHRADWERQFDEIMESIEPGPDVLQSGNE